MSIDGADGATALQGTRDRESIPGPGSTGVIVLLAALLGFFMLSLDSTAVNVALPGIERDLGGSTAGLQWVIDAYTLMFAALLLSAGAVSDRVGAKRLFAVGLAAFLASSAACGLAPTIGFLIGSRAVQGSAAAVMLPASLALVRQAYADPVRRAKAIAVWAVGGTVAMAGGPVAGGALTSGLSWRAIFFLNLPAGLAAAVLLSRAPRSPRRAAPLDPAGQVTAVAALAALTFGVIDGGETGFARPAVLGCLLLAVVAMAAFAIAETRAAHPMVPLGLFRSRTVTVCVAIGFAVNVAFYGVIFVLSLYFQRVLGQSAVTAGLEFLPMTALLPAANLASARLGSRFGPQAPIKAGLLVSVLGLVALLAVSARQGPADRGARPRRDRPGLGRAVGDHRAARRHPGRSGRDGGGAAQLEPPGWRHAGRRGVRRDDLAPGLVPAWHAGQPADRRRGAVRGRRGGVHAAAAA